MIPLTLVLVVVLLYVSMRGWPQTLLVLSSLPFAVAGSVWLLAFMDYNLSTASSRYTTMTMPVSAATPATAMSPTHTAATGFIVGIGWSAWHLLPNVWASRAASGELAVRLPGGDRYRRRRRIPDRLQGAHGLGL